VNTIHLERRPELSVLVPTWGRPEELGRCLAALAEELHPGAEALTIHAPGDRPALELVRRRFPRVRAIEAPERNLSAQRNLGVRAAQGRVVVFIDDDAWPRPGWLRALTAPLLEGQADGGGGRVLHPDGREQYGAMAVTGLGRPIRLAPGARPRAGHAPILPGGNMAVRRSALEAIGGVDENFDYHFDDVDLSLRLHRAGMALLHLPAAEVYHASAPGPHRRDPWDKDWYTITKNSIYFAFRHAGPLPARLLGPLVLQAPKTARFLLWAAQGRLGAPSLLGCLWGQLRGLLAGYAKGALARPRLPLAAAPGVRR